jgi:hypothetical protein
MKLHLFLLLFAPAVYGQNVGIGTSTPATPLHIRSTVGQVLRVEGTNPYISFFNGSVYSGYLWYNSDKMELGTPVGSGEPVLIAPGRINTAYFTTAGNVGIGIASPTEKLHINGNLNITGLLKVNGSSGSTGQVLTSNGAGDPQWKDAAHSNNTRFCFTMNQPGTTATAVSFNATRYNLNTADIVRNPTSITINKTGLYRFDINLTFFIDYDAGAAAAPEINYMELLVDGIGYQVLLRSTGRPQEPNNADYWLTHLSSINLHIAAPATITLRYFIDVSGLPVGSLVKGQFIGNLISE